MIETSKSFRLQVLENCVAYELEKKEKDGDTTGEGGDDEKDGEAISW